MAEMNTSAIVAKAADVAFRGVSGPGKGQLMQLLRDALASTRPADVSAERWVNECMRKQMEPRR